MEDNIYCLDHEHDEFYYEVYVCHRDRWLLRYKLMVKELNNQYNKLKRVEKRYEIGLSKERCKFADESYERAKVQRHRPL